MASLGFSACGGGGRKSGWPAEWNRVLVAKAVAQEDERFDERQQLVTRLLGPGYRYHTRLREVHAHPTRESLEYALGLLELGGDARVTRAKSVISRVLTLQDVDPGSTWYGIWGWYAEEPPDKMQPADWNWADFNGSTLLLIDLRHGETLGADLRQRIRVGIHHAAWSIARRNVGMDYTNIAAMGTFVTLAAGELLGDEALLAYALERIGRLAAAVDETGSFAEYNSPTYARVTIASLARIRMYVKDERARQIAARIEERVWLHIGSHWDAPRKQFAGPMSRCYATDLGSPAWLEKALDGRLSLIRANERGEPMLPGDLETAIHDIRCPDAVTPLFLQPQLPHQHREIHVKGGDGVAPVLGTTWLTERYSLGSVNRGDFWNQRRPILAYWGDAQRPARSMTVRVIKDGYDFSSAQLYCVQEKDSVLAVVNFRNPGGDRHISLDPIKDGRFKCGRLFVEIDFEGLPAQSQTRLENGVFTLSSPSVGVSVHIGGGTFGRFQPRAKLTQASESATITVDFLPDGGPHDVVWASVREAWLVFSAAFTDGPPPASMATPVVETSNGLVTARWQSPAAALAVTASARVDESGRLARAFQATIDGRPVSTPRLSGNKLAS